MTQGLVCAFSTLEPCRSFTVAGNRETKRLEVVRRPRQCLHFYWYLIDPEFGWMHVRLQSWAPYSIQVYVNVCIPTKSASRFQPEAGHRSGLFATPGAQAWREFSRCQKTVS